MYKNVGGAHDWNANSLHEPQSIYVSKHSVGVINIRTSAILLNVIGNINAILQENVVSAM